MALSSYTAYGPNSRVPSSIPKNVRYAGRVGQCLPYKNNLDSINRGWIKRFRFTVKIKGVASAGHKVSFYNVNDLRRCIGGAVSDGSGIVEFVTWEANNIVAVVEDLPGGDYYNTMIRSDLVPVAIPLPI